MITSGLVNSFKVGLLNGEFDFSSDTTQVFKIALFTQNATLGPTTTVYSATNEASGSGYDAGGKELTISVVPTQSGGIAYLSFSNVTWSASSISARGALIYKADGVTNPAIAAIDFGTTKTTSGGNFVVQFPSADSQNAIIRIG
jgi:hypothetical protein